MKDVVDTEICWATVSRTRLHGKKTPKFLQPGDLLVLAKGARHVALVCPNHREGPTVCTQHFHHFRLHSQKNVNPHFLAVMLNHPTIQKSFDREASGVSVKHLRAEVVERVPIPLPDVPTQAHLVGLQRNLVTQQVRYRQLIQNGTRLINGLAGQLLQTQVS